MKPRLDILTAEQQRLWPELSQVPEHLPVESAKVESIKTIPKIASSLNSSDS